MAIRRHGYKVIYQPAAVVIHYEFGSSSLKETAIQLQKANKDKFAEKWRAELKKHYSPSLDNVILAADRIIETRKKILFIEDRIPDPTLGSGFPRSYDIVNCLVELGYHVCIFPLQDARAVKRVSYELQQKGVEIICEKSKLNFNAFASTRRTCFDTIWISRPHNMQQTIKIINKYMPNARIVYDAEALFVSRDILKAKLDGIDLNQKQIDKMIMAEIALLKNADALVTVSNHEKLIFMNHGFKNIEVIGHVYNITPTQKTFSERKDILFVGGFLTSPSPNEDAILYFVREVFPLVHAATGAKLWIVGTNNLESIYSLRSDNIIVTGRVDSLVEYYDNCKVFIVPTRYAAGIPYKLQECFAYGLPAVVTPLIADQLSLDESLVLIGDSADEFSSKIISCYNEEFVWYKLRNNSISYIEKECSLNAYMDKLNVILQNT
jgi:glycosyltransferase involved in cell wall biosynthesis